MKYINSTPTHTHWVGGGGICTLHSSRRVRWIFWVKFLRYFSSSNGFFFNTAVYEYIERNQYLSVCKIKKCRRCEAGRKGHECSQSGQKIKTKAQKRCQKKARRRFKNWLDARKTIHHLVPHKSALKHSKSSQDASRHTHLLHTFIG